MDKKTKMSNAMRKSWAKRRQKTALKLSGIAEAITEPAVSRFAQLTTPELAVISGMLMQANIASQWGVVAHKLNSEVQEEIANRKR